MSKTFDELFNEFLKNLANKTDDSSSKESKSENIFDAERIEHILEDFSKLGGDVDAEVEKTLDESLGEPHRIEHYSEGGLFYEKRIWNTTKGDFVKLVIREKSFSSNGKTKEDKIVLSLDEQLQNALAVENYENAAIIRDLIIAEKKNLKKNLK